ncbi:MAG TPA: tRNA (adenosine(37)-N6)-threonylcarbamoyltransferase complex transferase subunit TsaD [Solirubrobacterales bacterium]
MAGLILAIETSCDDTCAAVLDGPRVLANVISSQAAAHAQFGGVVPEVASRHHLDLAAPVVEAALAEAGVTLDEVEAVAVTTGPGLIGALLVGVSTAKAIAAPRRLPLIAVDHLQGHVAANFLESEPLEPPFLCLVASGGHTLLAGVREHAGYELLGQTLDDAAGEAFDKVARMLGLGYPGGPALEKLAGEGDPEAFAMPVAMSRNPGLDFSFSGLKTALVYLCRDLRPEGIEERRADLAASFQAAAVSQLVAKLERALKKGEWGAVALGGGVAANGALREAVRALCERRGVDLKLVARELCTDNAAMIGSAARFAEPIPYPAYLDYDAFPTSKNRADGPQSGDVGRFQAHRPAV